jgi:hypothetical protein
MKPLSIADYLDRLGRVAGEKAPPPRENSPFRPRSLPSPQTGGPASKPVFDRLAHASSETQEEDAPRRTPWAPKPVPLMARKSPPAVEQVKPEDIAVRLAEAYARGREEGLAEGRTEASDRHAAELADAGEQAEAQRQKSMNTRSSKAHSGPRSGRSRTMSGRPSPAFWRPFLPSRSLSALRTSWRRRLPGCVRALRPD